MCFSGGFALLTSSVLCKFNTESECFKRYIICLSSFVLMSEPYTEPYVMTVQATQQPTLMTV